MPKQVLNRIIDIFKRYPLWVWVAAALSCVAFVAVLSTGFADSNNMVDGNQVAKRELFAIASLVVSSLSLLMVYKSRLYLNVIDLLAALFVVYTTVTFFTLDSSAYTKQLVIWLLGALYFNIRVILASEKCTTIILVIAVFATGVVQAIIGLKQILITGFSNHTLYKVTGTFFNPGPYGGYIAIIAAMSVTLTILLYDNINKKPIRFNRNTILFWGAVLTSFFTLLVLPASMSRTAWIALIAALSVAVVLKYKIGSWIVRHRMLSISIAAVLIGATIGAYMMKADSADGRGITWAIGMNATMINPAFGAGTGHFAESFAQAQINYFSLRPADAAVAGSPEYGFNEYIQIVIEYGFVGFLIFILTIFFAAKSLLSSEKELLQCSSCSFSAYFSLEKHSFIPINSQLSNKKSAQKSTAKNITLIIFPYLKADKLSFAVGIALLAMVVFAFASYPFSLLPFLILLIVILALAANGAKGFEIRLLGRITIVVFTTLLSIYCYTQIESKQYKEWRTLQMLYNGKHYENVVDGYGELYPMLKDSPKFLFEYGHTLYFCGKHGESITILKQGLRLSCDPMFYNIIGNNYKALGETELAAESYTRAYDILPSRVYPLYLLVKLYNEAGQREKAVEYALKVLNHKDKVPSPATRDIKSEVREIYEKLSCER